MSRFAGPGLVLKRPLMPASELDSLGAATTWLNTPPLSVAALRGKVVLVSFWTYTCINWMRLQPYVRAWARRYRPQGLVVIGVHTPEFAFERDLGNVRRATEELNVDYPVAVDNDQAIWQAFSNNYWPALYFVDATGRLRGHAYGEGGYDASERMIQRLLREAGATGVYDELTDVLGQGAEAAADWDHLQSAENYLGEARTTNFASPGGAVLSRNRVYRFPSSLRLNHWALEGDWLMASQAAISNRAGGRLRYRFHARDLHLVMGPAVRRSTVRFRVTVDGEPPGLAHGLDVDGAGNGVITEQRMYQLIRQASPIADREFEVEFLDAGVETYAFTFG